jgi:hypothetical protein
VRVRLQGTPRLARDERSRMYRLLHKKECVRLADNTLVDDLPSFYSSSGDAADAVKDETLLYRRAHPASIPTDAPAQLTVAAQPPASGPLQAQVPLLPGALLHHRHLPRHLPGGPPALPAAAAASGGRRQPQRLAARQPLVRARPLPPPHPHTLRPSCSPPHPAWPTCQPSPPATRPRLPSARLPRLHDPPAGTPCSRTT